MPDRRAWGVVAADAVGAIVLAAGRASRMGAPKILLPWRGRALVLHVLDALAAAGVAPVIVVVAPHTPPLPRPFPARAGHRVPFELLCNPAAAEGMGTSLAAGAAALAGRVDAVVVCLGDQPAIDPATIRALVAALRPPAVAAVPIYQGGVRGHPVLFAASCLPELAALRGDRGGRDVLERHPWARVPVDAPAPGDVDTPEDYARLLAAPQVATGPGTAASAPRPERGAGAPGAADGGEGR